MELTVCVGFVHDVVVVVPGFQFQTRGARIDCVCRVQACSLKANKYNKNKTVKRNKKKSRN